MNFDQAYEKIKKVGLHVHHLDKLIIGGSYVDRSGPINIVELGFEIKLQDNIIYVNFGNGEIKCSSLDEAVDLVIKTIPVGKDIEPKPRSISDGEIEYYSK